MSERVSQADPRPKYQQVADIIRDRITSGRYSPGQELPSMADLGAELGVSDLTAQRAFYQLREQGLLIIRHGMLTRVATELPVAGATRDSLLQQARHIQEQVTRLVHAIETMPA